MSGDHLLLSDGSCLNVAIVVERCETSRDGGERRERVAAQALEVAEKYASRT